MRRLSAADVAAVAAAIAATVFAYRVHPDAVWALWAALLAGWAVVLYRGEAP